MLSDTGSSVEKLYQGNRKLVMGGTLSVAQLALACERPPANLRWQSLLYLLLAHLRRAPPAFSTRVCVQVEHKDVKECAKEVQGCAGLRYSYFSCKRGQMDARTRLRGNKGY